MLYILGYYSILFLALLSIVFYLLYVFYVYFEVFSQIHMTIFSYFYYILLSPSPLQLAMQNVIFISEMS